MLGWPFWGGVRSIYDFDCKTAGKRAQVLIFSPFLASCSSLSSDVLAFLLALSVRSGRASWQHRGGGRRVHLAGGLGVSCSPTAWGRAGRSRAVSVVRLPCWPYGRRSQANRLANQQNAQRFNKKCSIMTKIMDSILYFLRYKYVCFGVK